MSPPDLSRLAINAATLDWHRGLEELLSALARAGIRAVAPWRQQIQAYGIGASARLLREYDMTVTSLCRAGFFTDTESQDDGAAIDEVRRAIDEASEIRAESLAIVVGGLPRGSRDLHAAHERIEEGLEAVGRHARAQGMPLAIEPLHPMYAADRGCVNTVAHANDLCDSLGDGFGIAVDIYHVWWDRTLEAELRRAGGKRLMGFHLCDWLVPTTDMLLDRGMMGDGVADIPRIRGWMEAAGYSGYNEIEIFSAQNWWQKDPDEVLQVCRDRYLSVC